MKGVNDEAIDLSTTVKAEGGGRRHVPIRRDTGCHFTLLLIFTLRYAAWHWSAHKQEKKKTVLWAQHMHNHKRTKRSDQADQEIACSAHNHMWRIWSERKHTQLQPWHLEWRKTETMTDQETHAEMRLSSRKFGYLWLILICYSVCNWWSPVVKVRYCSVSSHYPLLSLSKSQLVF